MHATVSPVLADDLTKALTALRFTEQATAEIVALVPPAGRHELLKVIDGSRHPLRALQHLINRTHIAMLAKRLRTTTADAETVARHIREATR